MEILYHKGAIPIDRKEEIDEIMKSQKRQEVLSLIFNDIIDSAFFDYLSDDKNEPILIQTIKKYSLDPDALDFDNFDTTLFCKALKNIDSVNYNDFIKMHNTDEYKILMVILDDYLKERKYIEYSDNYKNFKDSTYPDIDQRLKSHYDNTKKIVDRFLNSGNNSNAASNNFATCKDPRYERLNKLFMNIVTDPKHKKTNSDINYINFLFEFIKTGSLYQLYSTSKESAPFFRQLKFKVIDSTADTEFVKLGESALSTTMYYSPFDRTIYINSKSPIFKNQFKNGNYAAGLVGSIHEVIHLIQDLFSKSPELAKPLLDKIKDPKERKAVKQIFIDITNVEEDKQEKNEIRNLLYFYKTGRDKFNAQTNEYIEALLKISPNINELANLIQYSKYYDSAHEKHAREASMRYTRDMLKEFKDTLLFPSTETDKFFKDLDDSITQQEEEFNKNVELYSIVKNAYYDYINSVTVEQLAELCIFNPTELSYLDFGYITNTDQFDQKDIKSIETMQMLTWHILKTKSDDFLKELLVYANKNKYEIIIEQLATLANDYPDKQFLLEEQKKIMLNNILTSVNAFSILDWNSCNNMYHSVIKTMTSNEKMEALSSLLYNKAYSLINGDLCNIDFANIPEYKIEEKIELINDICKQFFEEKYVKMGIDFAMNEEYHAYTIQQLTKFTLKYITYKKFKIKSELDKLNSKNNQGEKTKRLQAEYNKICDIESEYKKYNEIAERIRYSTNFDIANEDINKSKHRVNMAFFKKGKMLYPDKLDRMADKMRNGNNDDNNSPNTYLLQSPNNSNPDEM